MDTRRHIALHNRSAMYAANQGRFAEAVAKLAEAVNWAREIEAPLLVAVVKNNMGIVMQMQGRFADARACFLIARQTVEAHKPADHPLLRAVAKNLRHLELAALAEAA